MPKLFFDIETLPTEEKNYKKLKAIYDRKLKKGSKLGSFEEFIESTNFDGTWGEFCVLDMRLMMGQCSVWSEKRKK